MAEIEKEYLPGNLIRRTAKMNVTNAEKVYKEISLLTDNEKITLLSKLMLEISANIKKEQKVNIYDLKGVGKDIWEGIDAQEYVKKERESWT
jgi:hypothetical protein